ncbi:MAG: AraC family transcriptional regulator [Pseudomonadales bacterium]
MATRPSTPWQTENHLQTPDELSALLTNLELTARMFVAGDLCGQWTLDNRSSRQIPFHVLGSGEAWLHLDGALPQRLSAGDLVVFSRDQRHVISSSRELRRGLGDTGSHGGYDGTTSLVCGHFSFGDRRILLPVLDSLPPVVVLGGRGRPGGSQIKGLVSLILNELGTLRPGFHAFINQLGLLLFIETVRELVDQKRLRTGLLSGLFDPRLGPVLAAIHAHPGAPWTLEQLASLAALSRSSFVGRFRSRLGLPPMKYLSLWRMSEAKRLLRKTEQSMAAIAEATGYQSEPAFRKAFRAVVGIPPGRYRACNRSLGSSNSNSPD